MIKEIEVPPVQTDDFSSEDESPTSTPSPKIVKAPSPVNKWTWELEGRRILKNSRHALLSKAEKQVLEKLLRQGCPEKYRGRLWFVASGAQAAMYNNPGYYRNIQKNFVEYPHPGFHQVDLDLKRTFGEEDYPKLQSKIDTLRNILYAYVKRNSTIGYCQGHNFIVAHLLKYLKEEEAFWTFTCIIESILPVEYYSSMIGVMIDQRVFSELIKLMHPMLSNYLEKLMLDIMLISLQWFMCLFAHNVQSEVTDTIWDCSIINS